MIAASLKVATLTGAVLLLMDQSALALWGMVVTSVAGLVAQYLKDRAAAAADERRFRHDEAERKAAANGRAEISMSLAENTAITRDARDRADAAYDVANHVNAKIASIASAALAQDRATAQKNADAIRADIAKLDGPGPPTWPSR